MRGEKTQGAGPSDLRSYREALATALQALRPNLEVIVCGPEALASEVERLSPHIVVCSCASSLSVDISTLTWVQLYPAHESQAKVSISGTSSSFARIEFNDLLSVVDQTERLTQAG